MRNNTPKYCKSTSKYRYSSEAKATRAKNRYKDIRRIYLCDDCGDWHTTSMGTGLALQQGIIKRKEKKKSYSSEDIRKALEKLQNKIK